MPDSEGWQVWIDWYERRLKGTLLSEEAESVFVDITEEEWKKGFVAVNALIAERLKGLEEQKTPPKLPAQRGGPHFEVDSETGATIPAKPGSLDQDGNNVGKLRSLHPELKALAAELLAQVSQNEQPELFRAATNYGEQISRPLAEMDFDRLWALGETLKGKADAAGRPQNLDREPLGGDCLASLNALMRIHPAFIAATRAGQDNEAEADAFELSPAERREQKEASKELVSKFGSNSDVVAPESTALCAETQKLPEEEPRGERTAAYKAAAIKNVVITVGGGAGIAVMIGGVSYVGIVAGGGVGALIGAALGKQMTDPLIDALKKSKPYLATIGLCQEQFDKLADSDWQALAKKVQKIRFDRYKKFILDNETLLLRFFGSGARGKWLRDLIEWIKREERGE